MIFLLQKVKFHAKHIRVPPMKSNWIDFQTSKIQGGTCNGGVPGANRFDRLIFIFKKFTKKSFEFGGKG